MVFSYPVLFQFVQSKIKVDMNMKARKASYWFLGGDYIYRFKQREEQARVKINEQESELFNFNYHSSFIQDIDI